jgi:hypothetical protein
VGNKSSDGTPPKYAFAGKIVARSSDDLLPTAVQKVFRESLFRHQKKSKKKGNSSLMIARNVLAMAPGEFGSHDWVMESVKRREKKAKIS